MLVEQLCDKQSPGHSEREVNTPGDSFQFKSGAAGSFWSSIQDQWSFIYPAVWQPMARAEELMIHIQMTVC